MKSFVFVLSCVILVASAAVAASLEATREAEVVAAVQDAFLTRFVQRNGDRSDFSRAALPPTDTRVRVLGGSRKDREGADFVAFAIDTARGEPEWSPAVYTGCVYTASKAVYVKRDTFQYYHAFGRNTGKPISAPCTED